MLKICVMLLVTSSYKLVHRLTDLLATFVNDAAVVSHSLTWRISDGCSFGKLR